MALKQEKIFVVEGKELTLCYDFNALRFFLKVKQRDSVDEMADQVYLSILTGLQRYHSKDFKTLNDLGDFIDTVEDMTSLNGLVEEAPVMFGKYIQSRSGKPDEQKKTDEQPATLG